MQIADCEVRLFGDIANSIPKQNVTPSEVALLQAIHGSESVIRVNQTGSDRRSHKEEYERLSKIYGETRTNSGELLLQKIFPNSFDIKLPVNFSDIGVSVMEYIEKPVADIPDAADAADEFAPKVEDESELLQVEAEQKPSRRK
jgi:hypothetical protein